LIEGLIDSLCATEDRYDEDEEAQGVGRFLLTE
jgi:hypothetical protein